MSALVSRIKARKVRITDDQGIEHEFEGEGVLRLSGYGTTVENVELLFRLGSDGSE